jgi:hypothetical protein
MRFPPKSYNKDLESAEDRREREAQVLFVPVQLFPPRGFFDNMQCIPVDTDPDPAFQVNPDTDPDPDTIWIQGLMAKNLKKYSKKNFLLFLIKKIAISMQCNI